MEIGYQFAHEHPAEVTELRDKTGRTQMNMHSQSNEATMSVILPSSSGINNRIKSILLFCGVVHCVIVADLKLGVFGGWSSACLALAREDHTYGMTACLN